MPSTKIKYEDKNGFHYKHPERSCDRCLKFPCLPEMYKLRGNFAAYGCKNYSDVDTFEIWRPKR